MAALTVSALLILSVAIIAVSTKSDKDLFLEHQRRVFGFKCRDPQPRAIPILELHPESLSSEYDYNPKMTVLHRCENAGCCLEQNHACTAQNKEEIELVIKGISVFDRRARPKITKFTATNHTSCICMKTTNQPK